MSKGPWTLFNNGVRWYKRSEGLEKRTNMTTLTTPTFDTLARYSGTPSVTIILPIDRRHPNDRSEHMGLKRLVASVRAQLQATDTPDIDELLEPTDAVLQRTVIAEHTGGLGLFLAPGFAAEFAIDAPVAPLGTIGTTFTVGPLLPSIWDDPTCYVLTVGAENVALFRLDRSGWSTCQVPDLPSSLEEALWYERVERMSSSHAGGPVGARGMSIIGHGSGGQDEDRKERLGRFFQKVDDAVMHFLHTDLDTPLVIAGTGPSVARYQQVTRHRSVIPAPVGSPEELTKTELHERVKDLITPILTEPGAEFADRLAERLGTGLASADLLELVDAATQGLVSDLLVASIAPRWANQSTPLELLDVWEPGAVDVVNEIIGESWRHGARMHHVAPELLPDGSPLAALFRY